MIRVLLTIVLPLVAPTLLYVGYLTVGRRLRYRMYPGSQARADASPGRPQSWPWLWLLLAGAALVAVALTWLSESELEAPGGTYVPPEFIDGQVVPGHVDRDAEDSAE